MLRDHQPVTIDEFNGLFERGSGDTCPLDHFQDCNNLEFFGQSSFRTRPGIDISQDVLVPLENIRRIYNYPTNTANTLIILTYNSTTNVGTVYHMISATSVFGPILTITGMVDFAFQPYAGRGYISPIGFYTQGDLNIEKGLSGEFVYVYAGDGTAARKAAGSGMAGAMAIANGAAGHTDAGFHIFGFVSETISGYLAPPAILTSFTSNAAFSVSFGAIPTSGDPNVTKRHLVATKVIPTFNGDLQGYQFFFVPNATINDNVSIFLNNISFYDADLLDDASHLLDNYTSIPAGAALTMYHNRLCVFCTFTDMSLALVSAVGEPEAISQIDGLLVVPPDGNPITNGQELRDILYVFKRARTVSFADNDDVPSSWPLVVIDNALGTCIHGIATVLDTGTSSVDFLIICNYQGVSLFNGRYITPELSFKIEQFWRDQDRDLFRGIQIINAPIQKSIYIILPDLSMLVGNYANGMDPKKIRWSPWSFAMGVNTIAIFNIDEIIIGSDLVTA
jgi:hypothetical protein